jgi:nonsense-mediated mRNA decay protein 3
MTTGGKQYHTKTHLGHLLNIGDTALGFDLANSNVNDDNLDAVKPENLPDVVKYLFLSFFNSCIIYLWLFCL